MKNIVELIIKNTDWLYVRLFPNPIFFFDLWSFVHFWSGGVLITVLTCLKWNHKWRILFAILLGYEIIELSLVYSVNLSIFKPEIIQDTLSDLYVGMGGAYLFDKWIKSHRPNRNNSAGYIKNPSTHITLFTALTIAFLWVGFYKYEYNIPEINSPGLNYYAFLAWSAGIFVVISIFNMLAKRTKTFLALTVTWVFYFIPLCLIEFIGYYILGIKESGNHMHNPLIFNLIHGSAIMHIFYLMLPFISVGLYFMFDKLFKTAIQKR
jgi:hypothetical protein